jgi:NADH-quinone oxidoreductase subunit E
VRERLGVAPGETTPDGRVTFSTVECLGSCGTAPVVVVNGAYHENMSPEKVDRLLEGLK